MRKCYTCQYEAAEYAKAKADNDFEKAGEALRRYFGHLSNVRRLPNGRMTYKNYRHLTFDEVTRT